MAHPRSVFVCLVALLSAAVTPALAQKQGGTLKFYFFDSPATMSIHEESTVAGQGPMMGVFNNLVMYDQAIEQSGLKTIVPDLASEWAWDQAGTSLTFKLRAGVKWHDGKPFGARDVKCTWDLLMGKEGPNGESLRANPRKTWYGNLQEVVVEADDRVTFRLKRPQPPSSRSSRQGSPRSIPATSARPRCGGGRSAPGRSASSSSSPTRS
jgi:peptide/nickel transport system substrate-binding protein